MKRSIAVLFALVGLALGFPAGWCLRGRSVAGKEAVLRNMIEFEKAKLQWESGTNVTATTTR